MRKGQSLVNSLPYTWNAGITHYALRITHFNSEDTTLDISTEAVKALREKTGAGVMDCKRALQESGGDMAKAEEALREKGLTRQLKLAGRAVNQGLIESYIHTGGATRRLLQL